MSFETLFFEYFNRLERRIHLRPLNLGAISASGGGIGLPPGGYIGYLPQTRVAYDYSEIASLSIPLSGMSLLDNLNHVRYRLQVLEASGVGGAGGAFSIFYQGNLVASGVTIIDFLDSGIVNESSPGHVTIDLDIDFLSLDDTPNSYTSQANKIVSVRADETGLEFTTVSGISDTDEKVKISSDDTTSNYLENKIAAGTGVTLSVLNNGGNEQLQISSSGGGASLTVRESDNNPTISGVTTIVFDNSTVTDLGSGSVRVINSGAGSGSTDILMVQIFS